MLACCLMELHYLSLRWRRLLHLYYKCKKLVFALVFQENMSEKIYHFNHLLVFLAFDFLVNLSKKCGSPGQKKLKKDGNKHPPLLSDVSNLGKILTN